MRRWLAACLVAQACAAASAMAAVSFAPPVDHPIGATATVHAAVPSTLGAERAAVAVTAGGELILLHTDGAGAVAATERAALPEGTSHSVALADIDADGMPEALVGREGADGLAAYRRQGDALQRLPDIATGKGPAAPVAGDLNGDGHLDLVTRISGTTPADARFIRLMADGAGGFGPPQVVADPAAFTVAALGRHLLGDLDGDGDLDLVVSGVRPVPSASGSVISILLNDGTGAFGAPSEPFDGILGGLADVTGDDRPSILQQGEKGCLGAPGLRLCDDFAVKVLAGPGAVATVGERQQFLALAAQLDGTGPDDLILGGLPDGSLPAPSRVILPSLGGGTFGAPIPFITLEGSKLTAVDLNGDGATDLVASPGAGEGTIAVFLSKGATSGAFDFGEVPSGTAAERPFAVRNDGAAPVTLGTASIGGPARGDFTLVEDGCVGEVLPAGGTCDVRVHFRPAGTGLRTAQLQFSATPEPFRITLSGIGLAVPGPASGTPRCGTLAPPPPPGPGGAVRLTAGQLRINQRIGQAAIHRLDAVEAWLRAGVQGRDLCGGAIGAAKLAGGISTATALATLAEPSEPNPRPVTVAPVRAGRNGVVRLSAAQLRINQRISHAAIRRADALEARLAGKLTGGELAAGALTQDKLHPRLRVLAATPAAFEPAPSRTRVAAQRDGEGRVGLTAAQLRINQRIAQAAVRRANALVARLEAGLTGDAFAAGSITTRNLAPEVVPP